MKKSNEIHLILLLLLPHVVLINTLKNYLNYVLLFYKN